MRHYSLLLVALALAACKSDSDKDGYKSDLDCDDTSDQIYPGAVEKCDGIDNDCDGEIDEGVTGSFYEDADGDGYGNPDVDTQACSAPDGFVEDDNDCDDSSADIHPGAAETDCTDPVDYNCDGSVGYADADADGYAACEDCDDSDSAMNPGEAEVCDGKDNDCNSAVDDDPTDGTTYYIDYDEDGYGSDSYSVLACEDPGDLFVDNADDCDDMAATAHPGGTEVCDNGIDNDCDGLIDAEDDSVEGATTLYVDADEDGFGEDGSAMVACEDSSDFTDVPGDCDDTDAEVNPDMVEVCNNGKDDDCDGGYVGCTMDLNDSAAVYYGEDPDDGAGVSIASAGDVNSDGFDDFLVGADGNDHDGDGTAEGAAYLVYGPMTGGGVQVSLGDVDTKFLGIDDSEQAGYRVAGPGDMDGDSIPDIVIAASQHSEGKTKNGAIYFVSGAQVGSVDFDLSDADGLYYGSSNFDWLGGGVMPAGDLNDDGLADLLLGSTGEDGGGSQSGGVFVLYGENGLGDTADISDVAAIRYGAAASDKVGTAMAGVGDVDGDGVEDMVVGARYSATNGTNSGEFYVLSGPVTGSATLGDADIAVYGTSAGDYLGESISGFGDFDGDGYTEFLVGGSTEDSGASDAGAAYVFMGSSSISGWDGQDADSVASAKVTGASKDDRFAKELDGTGDFDDDGFNDLLVGSTSAGTSDRGMGWLFYGPISAGTISTDDADASFEGTYNDDHAGSSVRYLGDLDGTGHNALGISAVDGSLAGTGAGAVYILLDIAQ